MKKILLIAISILIISDISSQALTKGMFDLHLGVGFGIYTMQTNDYEDNSTAAVPGLFGLGALYQISDAFAIGLDYERNGFVTDADSNTKAVSQNFGLSVGYNVINKEKNVVQAIFHLGPSTFRFDNFNDQEHVKASGSQIQFGAAWKHFFGNKLGMYFNFTIPYISYNEFKDSDGNVYKIYNPANPFAEPKVFKATMSGVNFRTGLVFKLGG